MLLRTVWQLLFTWISLNTLELLAEVRSVDASDFLDQMYLVMNNSTHSGMVSKRTFSNRSRVLFVAGLEGTGHHAIRDMTNICLGKHKCEVEHELSNKMMHIREDHDNIMHGLFGAADYANMLDDSIAIYKRMCTLAHQGLPHLFIMGLDHVRDAGEMSYPNYNGVYKTLDRPDLYLMALMSEMAYLDIRFLILQRPAAEIIRSAGSRDFAGFKVLLDNAAALSQQLSLIDPRFFYCIQFHEVPQLSIKEKQNILNFMHDVTLAGLAGEMFQRFHPAPARKPLRYDRANQKSLLEEYAEFQLQSVLDLIDQRCKDSNKYNNR